MEKSSFLRCQKNQKIVLHEALGYATFFVVAKQSTEPQQLGGRRNVKLNAWCSAQIYALMNSIFDRFNARYDALPEPQRFFTAMAIILPFCFLMSSIYLAPLGIIYAVFLLKLRNAF